MARNTKRMGSKERAKARTLLSRFHAGDANLTAAQREQARSMAGGMRYAKALERGTFKPMLVANKLGKVSRTTSASSTPDTSNFQDKATAHRFHEPMAGVLKARHVGLGPKHTKARFSQPALAPVTPAQFARLEQDHAVRQYEIANANLVKSLALAEIREKEEKERNELRVMRS